MNEEQNATENSVDAGENTGTVSPAESSNVESQPVAGSENAEAQDDYYAVDYAKKDPISTIGDGEMHNEGLAGVDDDSTDISSLQESLSDEQDAAEFHDSEG